MEKQTNPEPSSRPRSRGRFKHKQEKPPDIAKIVTIVGIGFTILATLVLITLLN